METVPAGSKLWGGNDTLSLKFSMKYYNFLEVCDLYLYILK